MPVTIVAAVDRSPAALQAVRLLAGYQGDRATLSLVLLNVQPAAERRSLDEAAALIADAGFDMRKEVRFGSASAQILEEAARSGAALIIIGTRGHGAMRGFALGSVALRVAHGARVPVLLVRPDTVLPRTLGRSMRVLVALDGSPPATRALTEVLGWEKWLGQLDLDLAHVRRAPGLLGRLAPDEQAMIEEWGSLEAEEATRDARALLYAAQRACRLHEPAGDPSLELVRLAGSLGCDLVAMGTRGLGAAHHALVGSVALKVAIGSPAPVLLVP